MDYLISRIKFLFVVVGVVFWMTFFSNYYHNKVEQSLREEIVMLYKIDSTMVVRYSRLQATTICRDSSVHELLFERDTCGIWAYNWIHQNSQEYWWYKQRMDEDGRVVE